MTKVMGGLGVWIFAAIAGCVGAPSGGHCADDGDFGCICRVEPRPDEVPFGRVCDESAYAPERTLCCQSERYCYCEPVRCGVASDGDCICGIGILTARTFVGSCDGTASTCCTQDTGYCYCEEGCETRFGNRRVASCNPTTDTARCASGETPVASCE